MPHLSSYPNVFNTCLVLLRQEGFTLNYNKSNDTWEASKNGFSFLADNPIELLVLAAIFQKLEPKENTEYWWRISSPNIVSELDPE